VIYNPATNLVLDIEAESAENGSRVITWQPHNGENQLFQITNYSEETGAGCVQIRHSAKFVDMECAHQHSGAKLIQWEENGGPNQKFVFSPAGEDNYFVQCVHSGKYLQVSGNEPGSSVIQTDFNGSTHQMFALLVPNAAVVATDLDSSDDEEGICQ
jgi:hypothetical protein